MVKKIFQTFLVLTLAGLISTSLYKSYIPIRVNTTESMPRGIWLAIESSPSRGSFVEVRGVLKNVNVLKQIVGVAGDRYQVADSVEINGVEMEQSGVLDSGPEPLKKKGTLADGEWFILGKHRKSYDSRYIGPVTTEQIVNILEPFLVLE